MLAFVVYDYRDSRVHFSPWTVIPLLGSDQHVLCQYGLLVESFVADALILGMRCRRTP
jgi:hypothetical protein